MRFSGKIAPGKALGILTGQPGGSFATVLVLAKVSGDGFSGAALAKVSGATGGTACVAVFLDVSGKAGLFTSEAEAGVNTGFCLVWQLLLKIKAGKSRYKNHDILPEKKRLRGAL